MKVRTKFTLTGIALQEQGNLVLKFVKPETGAEARARRIAKKPLTDQLVITAANTPGALDELQIGKAYFVDVTPAE